MSASLRSLAALCMAVLGTALPASADAVVGVASEGDYAPATLRTVRAIASDALRERGIAVVDAPGMEPSIPSVEIALADAAGMGAESLYMVRLGRLDEKVFVSLEELSPPSATPLFTARLTASSIDEADTVIGRLVTAVVERQPVEAGARLTTVTRTEAQPFQKRPGEGFFNIGTGLTPLGLSLGWSYEARSWRLGVLLQGDDDDVSFFGIDGAWVPLDREVSPYVGVGLGAVNGGCNCDNVIGTKLEVGAEFFRLHGVRLIAGVNAIIPIGSQPGGDRFNPGVHLRVGF